MILASQSELNVKEIRPPRMDDSGRMKYPVLFKVYVVLRSALRRLLAHPTNRPLCRYGGPGSQQIDQRFARSDWANYVACGLKTIVVIVDGRGTGFKGRKLRNPVKGNLGFFETIDQIEAAKQYAQKPFVDAKRIGIWGWVCALPHLVVGRDRLTYEASEYAVVWRVYELEGRGSECWGALSCDGCRCT